MAYLFGEYEHTMDEKGRVSLPSRFRKELPKTVVLAPGPNGQLNVFSQEGFANWTKSLFERDGGYNVNSAKHTKERQFYNSSASTVDIDNAGRVSISPKLRKFAGLEKDVVVTGDEDHACIWDKDRWEAYIGDFDPSEIFSEE
ncbi:MAG: division/cell wall cluster transcriptional repressor MraZ [Coriobacteriales bacterium]